MNRFEQDRKRAQHSRFDLIVVGGGVYGVALALEAASRGLKPLLLEKGNIGEATSRNSLSVIHGGLRYLQTLDFHRFYESVRERKWFLETFPELVKPLPCLMPLYNRSFHRTWIFRFALFLNTLLSWNRNIGVSKDNQLKAGGILSTRETIAYFPGVDVRGLKGGAVWYDAYMTDSSAVLVEMMRRATAKGAQALSNMEAKELIREKDGVQGIHALEPGSNRLFRFQAPIVVNCAGPWCREVARKMDRDIPQLFHTSMAFNILLDRKPLSNFSLAIIPNKANPRTYFLRPWKDKILAGTFHTTWNSGPEKPKPREEDLHTFLEDLNLAVPGLNLKREELSHTYCGLLPAKTEGSAELSSREVLIDHNRHGGPKGLFSVSGVKYTTARLVAEKTLGMIYG